MEISDSIGRTKYVPVYLNMIAESRIVKMEVKSRRELPYLSILHSRILVGHKNMVTYPKNFKERIGPSPGKPDNPVIGVSDYRQPPLFAKETRQSTANNHR